MQTVTLSLECLQLVLDYLAKQPFGQVAPIIAQVQQDIQKHAQNGQIRVEEGARSSVQ